MESPSTSSAEILQTRIERLEKENLRFKKIAVAALAGVALLIVMGQTPARKTVEANEFVVKDAHGSVRIRLGVDPKNDSAVLWMQTAKGDEAASLSDSGMLLQQDGVVRTIIGDSAVTLANSQGQPNVRLTAADDAERDLFIEGNTGYLSYLPGQALEITDSDGYSAAIGSTEIRGANGATHSNAASLVLTDPDKKVLWKAP